MKQEIHAIDPKVFFSIVRAIGSDLEHTQVRMITSANADMLFHYWKVGHFILYLQKKRRLGEAKLSTIYPRLYAHNIPTRRVFHSQPYLYVPVRKSLSYGSSNGNG